MSKSEEMDCLWTDEQMQVVRENMDLDSTKSWDAFGKIYQKYSGILMTLCIKICGDRSNADLVYETTWKKIWKNAKN